MGEGTRWAEWEEGPLPTRKRLPSPWASDRTPGGASGERLCRTEPGAASGSLLGHTGDRAPVQIHHPGASQQGRRRGGRRVLPPTSWCPSHWTGGLQQSPDWPRDTNVPWHLPWHWPAVQTPGGHGMPPPAPPAPAGPEVRPCARPSGSSGRTVGELGTSQPVAGPWARGRLPDPAGTRMGTVHRLHGMAGWTGLGGWHQAAQSCGEPEQQGAISRTGQARPGPPILRRPPPPDVRARVPKQPPRRGPGLEAMEVSRGPGLPRRGPP